MSTHIVAIEDGAVTEGIPGLLALVTEAVRAPTSIAVTGTDVTYTFTPDLTAGEIAIIAECVRTLRSPIQITRAERNAIQTDIDGLVTYQNLASPTLAQTALAVKALSRILKAAFRS